MNVAKVDASFCFIQQTRQFRILFENRTSNRYVKKLIRHETLFSSSQNLLYHTLLCRLSATPTCRDNDKWTLATHLNGVVRNCCAQRATQHFWSAHSFSIVRCGKYACSVYLHLQSHLFNCSQVCTHNALHIVSTTICHDTFTGELKCTPFVRHKTTVIHRTEHQSRDRIKDGCLYPTLCWPVGRDLTTLPHPFRRWPLAVWLYADAIMHSQFRLEVRVHIIYHSIAMPKDNAERGLEHKLTLDVGSVCQKHSECFVATGFGYISKNAPVVGSISSPHFACQWFKSSASRGMWTTQLFGCVDDRKLHRFRNGIIGNRKSNWQSAFCGINVGLHIFHDVLREWLYVHMHHKILFIYSCDGEILISFAPSAFF